MQKKLLIIIGILSALALVFFVLNLTTKSTGERRADIDSIFNNDIKIAELSELASSRGGVYNLKVVAANIQATSRSDAQQLAVDYNARYRKDPKEFNLKEEQDPAVALKDTEGGVDFDSKYKQLVSEQLQNNLSLMRTVVTQTSRQELKALLNTAIANQSGALEQLKHLP